jgi:hypothetical protein
MYHTMFSTTPKFAIRNFCEGWYWQREDGFFGFRQPGALKRQSRTEKLRVSVHPDYLERAIDVLAPLLLDQNTPFPQWKVIDMAHPDAVESRLAGAGQFTLYPPIGPGNTPEHHSEEQVLHIASTIDNVNTLLQTHGIPSGPALERDTPIGSGGYVSYRHSGFHRDEVPNLEQVRRLPLLSSLEEQLR